MHDSLNKIMRKSALQLPFLSEERRVDLARRIRGAEELRKLKAADAVFLSAGKSGRTWVRVMLSRVYQLAYGLPADRLLEFDNMKRRAPAVPAVFFTHGNYIEDFTGDAHWKRLLKRKPVVWLLRDPRDVAVSLYFQWKHRMNDLKIAITRYPPADGSMGVYEFLMGPETAFLARMLDFTTEWARELAAVDKALIQRYEDFRADPARKLAELVAFLGAPAEDAVIREAVEFAAFDRMKSMEAGAAFQGSGGRVATRDPANPDAYKARRAKVGGWRDYFTDAEIAEIDALVERRLAGAFGYK
jgi:Sulfotransferase domain